MPAPQDATPDTDLMHDAVDLRRFPWIRPLVSAYANDFASVAPLFAGDPSDPAVWRSTIARVQRAPRDRALVTAAVTRQLEHRDAPPAARAAAKLLGDPASVAIVTGQQAGAFGGPLYTVLKALTALRLARRVREAHGVPVVPVFWVDAEDHDWNEVRTATLLDRDTNVASLTLAAPEGAGERPVGALTFDASIQDALGALERALPATAFTADLVAALGRHYREGVSVSTACAGWLDVLLGPLGLVVFEADDKALKPAVADLFAAELANPSATVASVREAGQTMRALGHAPQIEPSEDAVCLFHLSAEGRIPLRRHGEGYVAGTRSWSPAAIRTLAIAEPEVFSPNVMLRPIVQDRLFPTVCYVAGPAELAYQAQLKGAYRAFGVEAPLLYSRASATVLDTAAARFLERHDVALETLQPQDESALNRLLERQLPVAIDRTLEQTDAYLATQAQTLKEAVATVDPTLAGAVDTTLERLRDTLKTLHGKVVQASKKKDDTLRRQFLRTRTLVFPEGHPQERLLNIAFFANRYGLDFAARLRDALPDATDRHYLLTL